MNKTKMTIRGSKKLKHGILSEDPNMKEIKEINEPQEAITSVTITEGTKMHDKYKKGVKFNRRITNSANKKAKLTTEVTGVDEDNLVEVVVKDHGTKDIHIPVVIGLRCPALTPVQVKKKQPDVSNVEENEASTNPKRKRGRPPKLHDKSPETLLPVNHENENAVQDAEKSKMDAKKEHSRPKRASKSVENFVINKSSGKILKGKRGKRRRTISSLNIDSLASVGKDSSKEKANNGIFKDSAAEDSVEKSFDTMSDDQPLVRWFTGMHLPTVDNTGGPQKEAEQSSEANKKPTENSLDTANGEIVAVNEKTLSFVKSSPIWEAIESMEVFRLIPQNPHFYPLNVLKESAREGQAISQMVNFSKVVENTSRLRSDSPRSTIEEFLEVLVELETHGFDVKVVRDRLTRLLVLKDKQEDLEARMKEAEDRMELKNVEEKKLEKEIERLDKLIQELNERRSGVVSKKELNGSEVGMLEGEIHGISERLDEARREFEQLVGASF